MRSTIIVVGICTICYVISLILGKASKSLDGSCGPLCSIFAVLSIAFMYLSAPVGLPLMLLTGKFDQ